MSKTGGPRTLMSKENDNIPLTGMRGHMATSPKTSGASMDKLHQGPEISSESQET